MKMIDALCCSLLLVSVASARRPAEEAHALIGTWRLVEFADLDKSGKWQYKYGEHPRGYVVYDATGYVHVQIMKVPPLAPFPEAETGDGKQPSTEHALAALHGLCSIFRHLHRGRKEACGHSSCRGELEAGLYRH